MSFAAVVIGTFQDDFPFQSRNNLSSPAYLYIQIKSSNQPPVGLNHLTFPVQKKKKKEEKSENKTILIFCQIQSSLY